MRIGTRVAVVLAAVAGLVGGVAAPAGAVERVRPLAQAHAHNDYEHDRPLLDALAHGFTSVEADIYLVDGALLVGHDPGDLRPDRTLESLYLEPLRKRVLASGGQVYPDRPRLFQLLVDIKLNGAAVYAHLDKVLRSPRYGWLFSRYRHGSVVPGAVTVVISGDRPREVMAGQRDRRAFYDGRLTSPGDLGPGADARLVPLVSDNWAKLFSWTGVGEMPDLERVKLRELVHRVHAAGQRLRFWATPDMPGSAREAVWRELAAAGVDHLNTDDLEGLRAFLGRHPSAVTGWPTSHRR
ncbi:hypothetical protein JOF53_003906 [Crossiella equi]|uniref:Altered inheritance of mitochondria protein 6 n=1 Tax=Crossiella equi TaxID=130796 RepID=A0ABS5AEM3_9PSEU|nr:phosphatidylinositol-specific phospholipase C/glycerophosphodiester phosphodiesterase family protein [Crossiella equi]MBP2475034.1 hypothetical protein [Crossiella equi]